MGNSNPVFQKNYENYLVQLSSTNADNWQSVLAIEADGSDKTAQISFLDRHFNISPTGVVDEQGCRPDYGICVILLKYLLMCPSVIPTDSNWVHSRDFKDTVQAQNTGMSDYATQNISALFTDDLEFLKSLINNLGGKILEGEYPYDLSAILYALPRVPILFLFNDKDDQFPAKTSILYEGRAHHFLDAECRVMIDWYLYERLKRLKLQHAH